jgi:hypothetical protein
MFPFSKFPLALTVTPVATTRDPRLQISSYALPDSMYFFEDTYSLIWV